MDKFKIDDHKIHYHPGRIAQWNDAKTLSSKLQVYPIYVEVSPVGQCNHRCTFCAVDYIGYVNRKLSTEVLGETFINMQENGVKSIMFAGEGEPMLHPDIDLLAIGADNLGIDVGFTTNGTRMDKSFCDRALSSCTFIKISMNGGDASTYSKIHQVKPEHFELVWKNIEYAVKLKRDLNLSTSIGVQSLLLPDNANSLPELAKRCWTVGVDYLVIKPYSHNPASVTQAYRDIEYKNLYNNTLLRCQQFVSSTFEVITRRKTMEDWDESSRGYSICNATPYFWAYIMATGDVFGCSAHLLDPRFNFGNINRDSFDKIWTGEKRRALIEEMETFDISNCRKNCRMNKVNKYLDSISNPGEHRNFI